jgi:ankyrin repeat protein
MELVSLWACALLFMWLRVDTLVCNSDGAFVSRQDGLTALIAASVKGQSEVVQILLLAGVNKDAADNVGCRGACYTLGLCAVIYVAQS